MNAIRLGTTVCQNNDNTKKSSNYLDSELICFSFHREILTPYDNRKQILKWESSCFHFFIQNEYILVRVRFESLLAFKKMCKHNIKERTAKITGSTTVLKHNRQVANITFQMVPLKTEQNYRPWIWVSVTVTSFDATIQHFNTEWFLLSRFIQKTNGSYNLSCSRQILCCRLWIFMEWNFVTLRKWFGRR